MFSTGQLIFAALFFIVFVVVISLSYKRDKKVHQVYYKRNFWVLIIFVLFVLLILGLKFYFGN